MSENDNIGVIANAHLAISDESTEGAYDERCIKLAELHSVAVDFQKTGVPASITRDLRATSKPDFMESNDVGAVRESQKIIGVLYRQVVREAVLPEDTEVIVDPDLLTEFSQELLEDAHENWARYARSVIRLMNKYGIRSEAQLITGTAIDSTRRKLRTKNDETKQRIQNEVDELRHRMREEFEAEFIEMLEDRQMARAPGEAAGGVGAGGAAGAAAGAAAWSASEVASSERFNREYEDDDGVTALEVAMHFPDIRNKVFQKASAWYYAGYTYIRAEREPLLLGLPWVVADVLSRLKQIRVDARAPRRAAAAAPAAAPLRRPS